MIINIICSDGDMYSVSSSVGSKVVDFKDLLAQISYYPAYKQRLIYRGMTLEDDRTLDSYGLKKYHTIHMKVVHNPRFALTETTPLSDTTTGGPGLDRPTGDMPDMSQLMLYPAIYMIMQSLLSNTQFMEQFIDQNPQLHDSIPQLREMMQNPEVARRLTSPQMMQGKDKTAEERRITIRIFVLVAKQCREAALRFYDAHLPFLFEACNDENSDVRQAAAYGLGVCAEYVGSAIKPLIGEALSSLNAVIRHPDALHPDNVMAYDNAVSALGKICHFHRDSIDSAQVIPAWLNCLPIKGDVVEAKAVHELLSVMVERPDAELLGPNNQYLPKIVSIFTEILCAGKDLASDQTISRISNLLRHNFGWDVSCVPDIQQPWMGCFG